MSTTSQTLFIYTQLRSNVASQNNKLFSTSLSLTLFTSSTTLSLTMAVSPTKWHFAAHMGQLLRDAGDSLVTPMGCSHLWPSCPYSSKKLLKLTNVVQLKWGRAPPEATADWWPNDVHRVQFLGKLPRSRRYDTRSHTQKRKYYASRVRYLQWDIGGDVSCSTKDTSEL